MLVSVPTLASYPANKSKVLAKDGGTAPSVSMVLYFSEAVQVVAGKAVTVSSPRESQIIPVTRTDSSVGNVQVFGSMVLIDPYFELQEDDVVTVTIAAGSFLDFAGNPYAGIHSVAPYQWQATKEFITKIVPNPLPPAREGTVLEAMCSAGGACRLLRYGGRSFYGGQGYFVVL